MSSANTTSNLKGSSVAAVMARLKAVAPYALIELVLPGGSLMALLLWLYRRQKNRIDFGPFSVKWVSFNRWIGIRAAAGNAILRAVPNCHVLGCEVAHSGRGRQIGH
jgi:hypothetical protein